MGDSPEFPFAVRDVMVQHRTRPSNVIRNRFILVPFRGSIDPVKRSHISERTHIGVRTNGRHYG